MVHAPQLAGARLPGDADGVAQNGTGRAWTCQRSGRQHHIAAILFLAVKDRVSSCRVSAMHWRSALPLEPSNLMAVSAVSSALPLASNPTAPIVASTPWPLVAFRMVSAGSSPWSKLVGMTP